MEDFMHDLKSALTKDKELSFLNNQQTTTEQAKNLGRAGAGFIDLLRESVSELCENIEKLNIFNTQKKYINSLYERFVCPTMFRYFKKRRHKE